MISFNKMIAQILRIPVSKITDKISIKNTEAWDSLKHMELIIGIEEAYKIQLTTDEIVKIVTIKKIKQVLRKKGVVINNEH